MKTEKKNQTYFCFGSQSQRLLALTWRKSHLWSRPFRHSPWQRSACSPWRAAHRSSQRSTPRRHRCSWPAPPRSCGRPRPGLAAPSHRRTEATPVRDVTRRQESPGPQTTPWLPLKQSMTKYYIAAALHHPETRQPIRMKHSFTLFCWFSTIKTPKVKNPQEKDLLWIVIQVKGHLVSHFKSCYIYMAGRLQRFVDVINYMNYKNMNLSKRKLMHLIFLLW